jgi:hypothetical protein
VPTFHGGRALGTGVIALSDQPAGMPPWHGRRDGPWAHCRGQSSVEAIVIIAALVAGAAGLGLFGEDGGVAGFFIDGLRRFHQGFGHALSLPG